MVVAVVNIVRTHPINIQPFCFSICQFVSRVRGVDIVQQQGADANNSAYRLWLLAYLPRMSINFQIVVVHNFSFGKKHMSVVVSAFVELEQVVQ